MKLRPSVPISPAERAARRTQRLVLGAGLGLTLLVAGMLVQGTWRRGHAVRTRYAALSEDLARYGAARDLAHRTETENADLLEAAGRELEELLPSAPDEKQWHDGLVVQARSFGLTEVKIKVEERADEQRSEDVVETLSEDDIGVGEPLAPVQSLGFQLKGIGRLRQVLAFVESLTEMQPLIRAARMEIKNKDVPFDHVELDLTLTFFWRVASDQDAG